MTYRRTKYVNEFRIIESGENVEIHRCPECSGVFGVDATFLDQIRIKVICPMCSIGVTVADPPDEQP